MTSKSRVNGGVVAVRMPPPSQTGFPQSLPNMPTPTTTTTTPKTRERRTVRETYATRATAVAQRCHAPILFASSCVCAALLYAYRALLKRQQPQHCVIIISLKFTQVHKYYATHMSVRTKCIMLWAKFTATFHTYIHSTCLYGIEDYYPHTRASAKIIDLSARARVQPKRCQVIHEPSEYIIQT